MMPAALSVTCRYQLPATRTERRSADGLPPDLAVRFRDVLVLYTMGISEPGGRNRQVVAAY